MSKNVKKSSTGRYTAPSLESIISNKEKNAVKMHARLLAEYKEKEKEIDDRFRFPMEFGNGKNIEKEAAKEELRKKYKDFFELATIRPSDILYATKLHHDLKLVEDYTWGRISSEEETLRLCIGNLNDDMNCYIPNHSMIKDRANYIKLKIEEIKTGSLHFVDQNTGDEVVRKVPLNQSLIQEADDILKQYEQKFPEKKYSGW
jgi:hypothetical protein